MTSNRLPGDALAAISKGVVLEEAFHDLVNAGGRLVGSESERHAAAALRSRLAEIPQARLYEHRFEYEAWTSRACALQVFTEGQPTLRSHPLYWSAETPSDGLEGQILDVGRGTESDFKALAQGMPGKIVLVRHEYPFSSDTIHRRLKYNWAKEQGAAGFLIANNVEGDLLVSGSCGQDAPDNIPAMGVSLETGRQLAAGAGARVRMHHASARRKATASNLIAEIAGEGPEWVVVCAHYDGHDLAESALDNATGVASAIAIMRAFAPAIPKLARGMRVILFTAEETGLLGSRLYVNSLSERQLGSISVVVNLDTLVGSPQLACLTSGFPDLERFVSALAPDAKFKCIRPLLRNSDHFNFARLGVPAMRLVAGFDEPESDVRYLLTEGDRRDRVPASALKAGAGAAARLIWNALAFPGTIATRSRA